MVLWVCEGERVWECGSVGDVGRENAATSGPAPAAAGRPSDWLCALGRAKMRLCSRSPGEGGG